MADAVVIEIGNRAAGIAVREHRGYRFFAADALFRRLDTRKFRQLRGLTAAVRDHARITAAEPPATRRW